MPIQEQNLSLAVRNKLNGPPYFKPGKKTWFVNSLAGGGSGGTFGTAFATMAAAFAVVESGDTILAWGKIREQLTAPVQIFDVTIIGMGNRPRHADAEPASLRGGSSTFTWAAPASPTAATPLLKLMQQGWRLVNILFAGPTGGDALDACVQLYRDAGAGDAERDASHAEFIDCRFASGSKGINDTGGCYGVLVKGNRFSALTHAIVGVGNIGQGQTQWVIEDNHFSGMDNGVKIAGYECRIRGNTFSDGVTPNTSYVLSVIGANNFVFENFFQTLTANFNTPDVVGDATSVWVRNESFDATSAGVGTNAEYGNPA